MAVDAWAESAFEDVRAVLVAARRRLHQLGHHDARLAQEGESPAGVDVVAAHTIASVKLDEGKVGLEAVQHFAGQAALHGKVGCIFSVGGFEDAAIAWADRAGVALFVFDRHGDAEPVGRVAADAVARNAAVDAELGTGDLADPVEVAAVLAAGLVGGPVGEVGRWFGGAGQLLTFWVDPGDRETPASVVLGLYPQVVGEIAPALDAGWERTGRDLPGGGREQLWVCRCAHANQPPTAVAGEAVARAAAALAACGVDFDRCRIELRPAAELDEDTADDVHSARQTVLGPLGHGQRLTPVVGDSADFAKILAQLVEHARKHRVAGRADLEGLTEDGQPAWRLTARLGGHARLAPDRWEIEARVPGHLLESDQSHRWFRPAKVTVGGTQWTLTDGQWRTVVEEDDLEIAAHEAVANVAAAYTLAGAALEQTAFRGTPEP
jgi:hypothetical protein